jgi:holo-[acyl-carrier protein] synthase
MKIYGIGTDLVEIDRIASSIRRHGDAFLGKMFTDNERRDCAMHADPSPHYAARFAAKEAVAKALGTGIGRHCGWLDVEVVRSDSGAPQIRLYADAMNFAQSNRINVVHVSLSHTHALATAHAVAVCDD